eukprot:TRINITY_DN19012_c0_g1_i1.p1 TRINITY_DN19012_c0_g1~~TRINITY_DN19012_c0_g1_i1.p1  ORF type:complete len:424 (-),score=69.73 TRINITY_DN19012_c0_g1_i1:195-1466(-)
MAAGYTNSYDDGLAFLEENKEKDGVITLASGLQYKVMREGTGMAHPTASTPCECHYAGRLLDGTLFDSSYNRGAPTTFAPNQVIKGWTEAMQLMVEGDKWEMYIPMELAYGPNGKPPKIPPKATLIFIMEIVKIQGASVPKAIVFPEWTEEQLKLWTPKDEASITTWRESRIKSYEEGKMRDAYPTREEFDTWLQKQCLSSKNKSLYKRTRPQRKSAVLWIHGLGDTGAGWEGKFGSVQCQLADVKFYHPTAPTQFVTCNRSEGTSWFDIADIPVAISEPEAPKGADESLQTLHRLLQKIEQSGVAADKIIIGGFSQGGAMSLHAGLSYPKRLGGIVSISGWCTHRADVKAWMSESGKSTPVLMLSGDGDPVVDISVTRQSGDLLKEVLGNGITLGYPKRAMHQPTEAEMEQVSSFMIDQLSQ